MRPFLAAAVLAAAVVSTPSAPAAAAVATTSTPVADDSASAALHAAADDVRAANGLDALYLRSAYASNAKRIATAALTTTSIAGPGDDAPMVWVAGTATDLTYWASVTASIQSVVTAATGVLRYPLHTDGGWSVVTKRLADNRIRYGVALVVGWPTPHVSKSSGCSSSGYCWSNGGLHPHLPWTRNTVKWYLSTSGLPAAGESLVKSAISKLNAISGLGADLRYGGKTSVTAPTSTRRFVIRFGSGCTSGSALGCTITSTQGTYRMVFEAETIVTLARYNANPSTTWWVGTLMHEIAHGTGLGHYDGAYAGTYQLMRSANGPDFVKSGDANGLRVVAPAGRVSASLTAKAATAGYALVVRTANSGLGGVRAIRTQCTDSAGTWKTVGLAAGTWDTRAASRTVGTYDPPAGATRYCRAIVRSKTGVVTTSSVTVR